MPPIGETLRNARMRQNLDIADVESYTKIRAKYLRALENEEWALLPGPTFVRTFLRTYAEAVGIDPHPLVDEYRRSWEPGEDVEPVQRSPRQPATSGRGGGIGPSRPSRRLAPGPPSPLALLGGVVALIVVVLVVLGSIGGDDEGGGSGSGDQAANTETARTTTARRAARPRPRPRTPAGVTVRIAPAVPTYACLDSGDGTDRVFEGILSSARTFRNARELRVNLGKRQVEITANGKRVTVPGGADPYGLQVTRTAANEITDGPRPCA